MQTETIGERIRYLREKNRKSQQQLANKLYVSQRTVSSWECDRTEPDAGTLIKLAEYLHTTLDYLMTGKSRL